jgi:LmbE family N-acetylglucosaminyl deacetylase
VTEGGACSQLDGSQAHYSDRIAALPHLPEDWSRAIAVVAHPDDLEYGAASAIARWTRQGKDIRYVLATRGEAGIDSIDPVQAAPLRTREQEASAATVGVSVVEFLDQPDGLVVNSLELRRDLAASIRRHRPEVIIASNYRLRWSAHGPWNHVDDRELGTALPDAVRDAANRWLFTDAGEPWGGVRWIAYAASTEPTHVVDVTGTIDLGVASLQCHRTYLDALGGDFDPDQFLRSGASAVGESAGVDYAVSFELLPS